MTTEATTPDAAITTDMLRYIAHTLGTTPEYMINVIMRSCLDVTIDDTPADTDTEEQTMAMTITQEQLDAMLDDATAAGEIRPSASFVDALLGSLGITIIPAEPPAEMVKLAREIALNTAPGKDGMMQAAALSALKYAVDVVRNAKPAPFNTAACIVRADILNALGAGGRDAG